MSTTPVNLAEADVLPNHIKLIRNALKKTLKSEARLQDIKAWHNVIKGADFKTPYGYVIFVSRLPIDGQHSTGFWEYRYNFQIGVVTELISTEEDATDDKALDLINLVESSIQKQEKVLGTTDLFMYPKTIDNQDYGFLPNVRHLSLKIGFTQEVKMG